MKKTLALLLASLMLLLPACGSHAGGNAPAPPSEQADGPAEEAGSAQPGGGLAPAAFAPASTLEETVLVEERDVKITATDLAYTADSVELSLTIENNSDKNLSFYGGTMGYCCNSINGYMVDSGYLNADVAAGKKTNETVRFDAEELILLGLTDVADIEMGFSVSDDAYDDYLETGPRQLKTSLADSYNYSADTYRSAITGGGAAVALGITVDHDSDETAYDQRGIRVLSQTLVTNSDGDHALLVEMENTSADMVYTSVGDIAVNGLGVQSGTWSTDWISAGKRRVVCMNLANALDESYREPFGIDRIGNVAYTLEVRDLEWNTLANPQPVTFTARGGSSYDASGDGLYQGNGIRVVSKGLVPDSSSYSDDIHLLLLAENGASEELNFDVKYDSVSVNGYMTDFSCGSKHIGTGGGAVLDVRLRGDSLERNKISKLSDITEVELTLEVENDSYKTVALAVVTVTVNQQP